MVFESEVVCHLLDDGVFSEQHDLCLLYLLAVDELKRGDAEVAMKKADEVGIGDAGCVCKVVDVDVLIYVCVDVVEHSDESLVLCPHSSLGFFHEMGEEHQDGATQAHLLPQIHIVVPFDISGESFCVVVGARIALWQSCFWMFSAHAAEEQ